MTVRAKSHVPECPKCHLKNPPKRHAEHCPKAQTTDRRKATASTNEFKVHEDEHVEFRSDNDNSLMGRSVAKQPENLVGSFIDLSNMVHLPSGRRR